MLKTVSHSPPHPRLCRAHGSVRDAGLKKRAPHHLDRLVPAQISADLLPVLRVVVVPADELVLDAPNPNIIKMVEVGLGVRDLHLVDQIRVAPWRLPVAAHWPLDWEQLRLSHPLDLAVPRYASHFQLYRSVLLDNPTVLHNLNRYNR